MVTPVNHQLWQICFAERLLSSIQCHWGIHVIAPGHATQLWEMLLSRSQESSCNLKCNDKETSRVHCCKFIASVRKLLFFWAGGISYLGYGKLWTAKKHWSRQETVVKKISSIQRRIHCWQTVLAPYYLQFQRLLPLTSEALTRLPRMHGIQQPDFIPVRLLFWMVITAIPTSDHDCN